MTSFALDEHDEQFIRRQLETGRYDSASDVVRAGLRMLENFESAGGNWLEELSTRMADLEANPEAASPMEDVFARLEAHHRNRLSQRR